MERRIPSVSRPLAMQLGPGGEVDSVEARPFHRRRRDPDVYLDRPGLAQHAHDGPLGVAAHDRVVHDHNAFAAHGVAQRVQLEPDAQLPDGLRGLDEGAPHVGVLHQAHPERHDPTPRRTRSRPAYPTRVPRSPGRPPPGAPGPAAGRSGCAPGRRCARRWWYPGGPGTRTRTGSPWGRGWRTGWSAARPRRSRPAHRARSRARSWRRRCRARRSRWPPPSPGPADRAPAGARPVRRGRRTRCSHP